MAIKNNALVLFIGLITFSCQEKIVETPCPESKDYGLITVMPESMDFIPKSYKDSEKLVFKNSEGEEIVFYPVNEGVKSIKSGGSTTFLCEDSEDILFEFEWERLSISYKSTNNYSFTVSVETKYLVDRKNKKRPIQFYDLMSVIMTKQRENDEMLEDNICYLNVPISYRGEDTLELSYPHVQYDYSEESEINGKLFKAVYNSECVNVQKVSYQKEGGLVSFVDSQGDEWVLERTEKFEEGKAPNIELPDVNGQIMSLYGLEGELILIDFWASWCAPCRIESEEILKPLYNEFSEKGLEIFGVSIDTEIEEWSEAVETDGLNWYQVIDQQGYGSEIFTNYQIYGIPTIYVLDSEKNILSKNMRGEDLSLFVSEYLD